MEPLVDEIFISRLNISDFTSFKDTCLKLKSFALSGKTKHKLRVQIYELRVRIHELRVQIHELRVQIHELDSKHTS